MEVGYVELNGDPCAKCCISFACPKEDKCMCDVYWETHPEDKHNEDSEVYFVNI